MVSADRAGEEGGERKGKPLYPQAEREGWFWCVDGRVLRVVCVAWSSAEMTDANTLASVTIVREQAMRADRGLPVDMTHERGSDGWMERSFAY